MVVSGVRGRMERNHYDVPKHFWAEPTVKGSYNREDELLDRLQRFPTPSEVVELVSRLRAPLLRQMTTEIINGSIVFAKSGDRLEHIKLLNSWIATAEETVASGRRVEQILSRRKSNRGA